jgi:hypothetical protein
LFEDRFRPSLSLASSRDPLAISLEQRLTVMAKEEAEIPLFDLP